MLMKAAQWLVDSLFSDFSNADQRITCIYGCELWLYTILSTLGLLTLGVFLQSFWEAVIIIFIFYTCQSTGGGFHASSHMRCFLTMAIGLLTGLLLMKVPVFQCAYRICVYFLSSRYCCFLFACIPTNSTWRVMKRRCVNNLILLLYALPSVSLAWAYWKI